MSLKVTSARRGTVPPKKRPPSLRPPRREHFAPLRTSLLAQRMGVWGALALLVACLLSLGDRAVAQTRYGGGLQMMGSTVVESVGPGVHFRTSFPMNQDLSLAVGTTVTSFLFEGQDRAGYAFDPELSLIVTMPSSSNSSPYFLGGGGAHVPIGADRYKDVTTGPTFHLGLGKVWQRGATSLYIELSPTLFFRRERTALLLPLRGGIIF
jgi:hypothetical protein